MVKLQIKNMYAGYGRKRVLKDMDMTVEEGDFLGVIGPNGCGKSTLIRAITGVVDTLEGRVVLDGRKIGDMSRRDMARKVAVVPQDTHIGFPFTVWEVVLMGRNPYTGRFDSLTSEDFRCARRAMEKTGIEYLKDRKVNELSGGELQRVVIARAIAQEPKLLLLDEATSHLDIGHKIETMDMVKKMNKEEGVTVISIHHNLDMAARYCDRLVLIDGGRIRTVGEPEEVLTPGHLRAVYGIEAEIHENPRDGTLYISPIDRKEIDRTFGKKVHVICGGGSGSKIMKLLVDVGYGVSAGVLNAMDTDLERAEFLDVDVVTEAPFSPIGEESKERNLEKIREASSVVITDFPVGPGNISNLEQGLQALKMGKQVLLIRRKDPDSMDYVGGRGKELYDELKDAGAKIVKTKNEIFEALE